MLEGDRTWHAGWALGQLGLIAVSLLVAGAHGARAAAALATAAIPGVLGAIWSGGAARRASLCAVWTVCAALAAGVAGGVASSMSAYLLAPALAAWALGAGAAWAVGLAAAAAAFAAVVGRGGGLGSGLDGWIGWGAVAVMAGAAAVSLGPGAEPAAEPLLLESERLRLAEAARAEAERQRDDARDSAAARTRFLAHMSHELRTPLNAVIGFSDIMRTRLFGPLPERYAEYAQLIHESGEHLLDVINDVLDLAKTEAGRYELRRDVFDARDALNGALRLTRVQADEAGVYLRGVLPPTPLMVDADSRALKQMALNLLSNALKFTPRGGGVVATLAAVEGEAQLVVADTGVGIAPAELERLGRPFEQGEAAAGRQGTGLGLSLVRAFAGLHGGDMRIESRLGAGTTVTVRLPVLADAQSSTGIDTAVAG